MTPRPDRPAHFIRPTEAYFPLTNDFVDRILPTLSPSQAVVVLVIYRHTVGYWTEAVTLSHIDISELCGLSESTVKRSVEELKQAGWITRIDHGPGKSATWSVNWGVGQNDLPTQVNLTQGVGQNDLPQADPVLIEGCKDNSKDNNPPTPLELDRPADKWATAQARAVGVKLRLNSAKRRQALQEGDSAELREQILAVITAAGTGEDVTDAVMRLTGRRSTGFTRSEMRPNHTARSARPGLITKPTHDPALQESPLAQDVWDSRAEAGISPRLGDFLHLPAWKVAVLDAMRLQDKTGFRRRLTETFTNLADDYRQGVNTDAIVEAFFDQEQRRHRSAQRAPENAIDAYLKTRAAQADA